MPLQWSANGNSILVAHYWHFDIEAQRFKKTRPALYGQQPDALWQVLQDPDTKNMAWFDSALTILLSDAGSNHYNTLTIPNWLNTKNPAEDGIKNTPFFLNSNTIAVQQVQYNAEHKPVCGLYDISKQAWLPVKKRACIEADFSNISKVEYLSGQHYLAYSSAEGTASINLVSLSLGSNGTITQTDVAQLMTGTASPQQIKLIDNQSAYYISSCSIVSGTFPRCEDRHDPEKDSWQIYKWDFNSKKLLSTETKLPIGSVFSPTTMDYAWINDISHKELCIKHFNQSDKQMCVRLPT